DAGLALLAPCGAWPLGSLRLRGARVNTTPNPLSGLQYLRLGSRASGMPALARVLLVLFSGVLATIVAAELLTLFYSALASGVLTVHGASFLWAFLPAENKSVTTPQNKD